ncbi:hypothetical protein BCV69DRAFT_312996 [Microstroma glucosiphilum]|uniref:Arrestin C-terminal-like domain-containing protein n=1 Tax=Pseudomicrostroma glucosiphilum TaxID=1684307 RepID=A0A316U597_9BASI|nr:hypothetical protein BCV69DRAFT_312996 [Pseudomicrostroma glucosiphilum]PWN20409.1 hypothetical protein BCV69DRAFT_312996 [Pseudomicrostroma glucosiphilum]
MFSPPLPLPPASHGSPVWPDAHATPQRQEDHTEAGFTSLQAKGGPTSVAKHDKVKLMIALDQATYLAGDCLTGKVELASSTSQNLRLGEIAVDLMGIEELTPRDRAASRTFLQSRVLFQGGYLPPSNAVLPSAPIHGHWAARKGKTTFPFSCRLPSTGSSSVTFAGCAKVRYSVKASVQICYEGTRFSLVCAAEADVAERWEDAHAPQYRRPVESVGEAKLFMGGRSGIWLEAALDRSLYFVGEQAVVRVGVRNWSKRDTSGVRLQVIRTLTLSTEGVGGAQEPSISEAVHTQLFQGSAFDFKAQSEVVLHLPIDIPAGARTVRRSRLFDVSIEIVAALPLGTFAKDLEVRLPIFVAHEKVQSHEGGPELDANSCRHRTQLASLLRSQTAQIYTDPYSADPMQKAASPVDENVESLVSDRRLMIGPSSLSPPLSSVRDVEDNSCQLNLAIMSVEPESNPNTIKKARSKSKTTTISKKEVDLFERLANDDEGQEERGIVAKDLQSHGTGPKECGVAVSPQLVHSAVTSTQTPCEPKVAVETAFNSGDEQLRNNGGQGVSHLHTPSTPEPIAKDSYLLKRPIPVSPPPARQNPKANASLGISSAQGRGLGALETRLSLLRTIPLPTVPSNRAGTSQATGVKAQSVVNGAPRKSFKQSKPPDASRTDETNVSLLKRNVLGSPERNHRIEGLQSSPVEASASNAKAQRGGRGGRVTSVTALWSSIVEKNDTAVFTPAGPGAVRHKLRREDKHKSAGPTTALTSPTTSPTFVRTGAVAPLMSRRIVSPPSLDTSLSRVHLSKGSFSGSSRGKTPQGHVDRTHASPSSSPTCVISAAKLTFDVPAPSSAQRDMQTRDKTRPGREVLMMPEEETSVDGRGTTRVLGRQRMGELRALWDGAGAGAE